MTHRINTILICAMITIITFANDGLLYVDYSHMLFFIWLLWGIFLFFLVSYLLQKRREFNTRKVIRVSHMLEHGKGDRDKELELLKQWASREKHWPLMESDE